MRLQMFNICILYFSDNSLPNVASKNFWAKMSIVCPILSCGNFFRKNLQIYFLFLYFSRQIDKHWNFIYIMIYFLLLSAIWLAIHFNWLLSTLIEKGERHTKYTFTISNFICCVFFWIHSLHHSTDSVRIVFAHSSWRCRSAMLQFLHSNVICVILYNIYLSYSSFSSSSNSFPKQF